MKKMNTLTIAVGILFITFWNLGCSKNKESLAEDNGAIKGTAANPAYYGGKISILSSGFDPQEFYVRETATVVWFNNDDAVHTVTADNGAFDSGDLSGGATFQYAFNTRGDYPYHCKHHPEKRGIIKAVVIIK